MALKDQQRKVVRLSDEYRKLYNVDEVFIVKFSLE